MNDELELMIDKFGLHNVLTALEQVCQEKADHIRSAWQDRVLANAWDAAAVACANASRKITV